MEFCKLGDLSAFIKKRQQEQGRGLSQAVVVHFLKHLGKNAVYLSLLANSWD